MTLLMSPRFYGESRETVGLEGLHLALVSLIISCGQTPTQKVIGARLRFVGFNEGTTHDVTPAAPRSRPGLPSGLSATCASSCHRSSCGEAPSPESLGSELLCVTRPPSPGFLPERHAST